jgi:hypothetical protein
MRAYPKVLLALLWIEKAYANTNDLTKLCPNAGTLVKLGCCKFILSCLNVFFAPIIPEKP